MRALVRMKVADDMDIVAAKQALVTSDSFFTAVGKRAEVAGITPFAVIQSLQL